MHILDIWQGFEYAFGYRFPKTIDNCLSQDSIPRWNRYVHSIKHRDF